MKKTFDGVAALGRQVRLLKDLIEKQVGELADEVGCTIKANALSPLYLLHMQGPQSTAEIANTLIDSHQLTSQRINWLHENGFVDIKDSEDDLRQRVVSLTRAGKKEAKLVVKLTRKLEEAYSAVFDEVGFDGLEAVNKILTALKSQSLSDRV